MVTMTINFNEKKLLEAGKTTDKLLSVYDDYCSEHSISKPKINVFEKDGIHALALIGNIMCDITKSDSLLKLIDTWYWDIDGECEELLEGAIKWNRRFEEERMKKLQNIEELFIKL